MAIYFGTTEITKLRDLAPQSGLDITDLWFGSTNVYTVWQVYEGTLPATLNANGADMRLYQIWGNTGGVGDEVDITGLSEPLCGIGTYTDSLDLSTGVLTRRINKLVLTGQEPWFYRSGNPPNVFFFELAGVKCVNNLGLCTHYSNQQSGSFSTLKDKHLLVRLATDGTKTYIGIRDSSPFSTLSDFKAYIAQFYTNGNPITVWFAHEEPEVSTITIPSGLTGTLEGYLIQDGTPTPETPIYPTANGIKQANNTYSIKYGYKLDMSVSDGTNTTTTPIYIGDDPLDKDEYVDYQAGKVFRRTENLLNWENVREGYQISPSTGFPTAWTATDSQRIATMSPIDISGAETVVVSYDFAGISVNDVRFMYSLLDNNDTLIERIANKLSGANISIPPNAVKMYLAWYRTLTMLTTDDITNAMVTKTPPETYISYLQPTDPPVPLPALPTCEGATIVDYAGSGTAPEKVLLKYRKEGY